MPRKLRPVTFTCEWCSEEKAEDRVPGPVPRYCAGCKAEAQRAQSRPSAAPPGAPGRRVGQTPTAAEAVNGSDFVFPNRP